MLLRRNFRISLQWICIHCTLFYVFRYKNSSWYLCSSCNSRVHDKLVTRGVSILYSTGQVKLRDQQTIWKHDSVFISLASVFDFITVDSWLASHCTMMKCGRLGGQSWLLWLADLKYRWLSGTEIMYRYLSILRISASGRVDRVTRVGAVVYQQL